MSEQVPPERLPARRRSRGPHPSSGEALRSRVLGERGRISRLSRIREVVLGFQDGLLVPLAVVTGLAGATISSAVVIVGGLAGLAAGALSMGTGAFLASQAENQLFKTEIEDEEDETRDHPEVERLELEMLLTEEGVAKDDAKTASEIIARTPSSLNKTKVEKELGISYEETRTAGKDAVVVGLSYAGGAIVPLWPYLLWNVASALPVSLVATALALFILGSIKGRVTRLSIVRSGIQVLAVGGASATIGYLIGLIAPSLLGG